MLPQLEFVTYISQVFWLCVSFSFLWIFCAFVLLPSIVSRITDRDNHIRANIVAANEAMMELDRISRLISDKVLELESKIQAINEFSKRECIAIREKKMRHIELEIDDFLNRRMLEFYNDIDVSKNDIDATVTFISELLCRKTSAQSLCKLPFDPGIVSSTVRESFF